MRFFVLALVVGLTGCRTTRGSGDGLGEGLASFYGKELHGRPTASGEPFDKEAFTAAHRTLPFGACVLVTVLASGATVEVRVNDRGPFVAGRIIDVSEAAARTLGFIDAGVARVRLRRCD
ncbi:MAG: septal ring lytic transglycosylase RlpA family lipoprotein [Archangium gephyra]|uniref:Probable endolytic peptidoglycan transglycosylase RlpA n=1 Tax=Archangium gephyra TaxID=48 RepID=A0A2W5VWF2_9BACT|nr:MAG: septal ring lytic transglycosylase RlpA family lipoprotein [Archangium gephyra]